MGLALSAPVLCLASRGPTDDLITRFALSPDGRSCCLIWRLNLPGRGAWVTNTKEFVDQAVEKRAFDRVWRRKVNVAE